MNNASQAQDDGLALISFLLGFDNGLGGGGVEMVRCCKI
jgi:hypothetical protein